MVLILPAPAPWAGSQDAQGNSALESSAVLLQAATKKVPHAPRWLSEGEFPACWPAPVTLDKL